MRRLIAILSCMATVLAGCVALLTGPTAAQAAPAITQQAGTFHPLDALRVLDTRTSHGLASAQIVRFAVAGRGAGSGAIPADAAAVTINMTVLGPARAGSISVFPGDTAWNGAASISFAAKQAKQNMITAKLGGNGTLAVRNNIASTIQVIGDVVGYYTGGTASTPGAFQSIPMQRAFDTRTSHPLATLSVTTMQVAGKGAVPASGVSAVLANLTVIGPARSGSVSTWASNAAWDGSASESFAAGRSEQDVLAVSLGPDGAAMIRNNTGVSLQVVLDVIGYYLAGTPTGYGAYQPITPTRIFDSRLNNLSNYPLATGVPASVPAYRDAVSGAVRLPRWQVPAVVVRYTVLTPAKAGAISVFPGTELWNGSASMSFGAAVSVQQQLTTVLGPDGQLQLQNDTSANLLVIADVLGYYLGVPNPLHYTGSQVIDPRHGRLAAVSCPAASFCMAAQQSGYATSWNGSRWGRPAPVGQAAALSSVSCTSASFCLAGGSTASGVPELSTFNGSAWSHAAGLTGPSSDVQVSCASTTFCLATDESSYRTFDGTGWSAEQPTPGALRNLSCATSTFCRAVDHLGKLYTFTGTGWSAPFVLAGFAPWAVSCATASFCAAVGQDAVAQLNGASWTVTPGVDAGRSLLGVSCASSSNCRAVDNLGGVIHFDGTNWSGPVAVDPYGAVAISCAAAGNCAVIDSSAHVTAVLFDGTNWSAPQPVDLLPGNLAGISCPTTDFCVAVDSGGYALRYDGTAWSAPAQIDGGTELTSVSCAPPSSCVAVDAAGRALTFDGSTWSAPVPVDPGQRLTAVSCADPSFCVAVAADGKAASFNGSTWSAPKAVFSTVPSAVSCPTEAFCAATDFSGNAATFNGTSWSAPVAGSGSGTNGLSCVSASFCLAAGTYFAAWNGSTWSPIAGPVRHGDLALSCPDQQLCVLTNADGAGQALVWNGSDWSMSVDTPAGGSYTAADISCPTTDFCMQVNGYTSVYTLSS
jgi:hypothetical protein